MAEATLEEFAIALAKAVSVIGLTGAAFAIVVAIIGAVVGLL